MSAAKCTPSNAPPRAKDLAQRAARASGQALAAARAMRGEVLTVDTTAAKVEATRYLKAAGTTGTVILGVTGINTLDVTATATSRSARTR